MTDNNKQSKNKPDVPVWTAPKIEAIPEKFKWDDIGKDNFIMLAIISFVKGLNSFGEEKHIITAWQVNPNNDKIMSEKQYLFESNSQTVKKMYQDRYSDWSDKMMSERLWAMQSSSQNVGLYIVKPE